MNFVGLSQYVQTAEGQKKIYNLERDLIVEVTPQQKVFTIEYQDKEITFRFEGQKVLVRTDAKTGSTRKVIQTNEIEDYLKSLRLDFLVSTVLKKVPFLKEEA